MSDNRRLALEYAHSFGIRDHRELLRTAMEIEYYLELGTRPPVPGESKHVKLEITNEAIRDLIEIHGFDPLYWFTEEVQQLKKTVEMEDALVEFHLDPSKDPDGNITFALIGEKKSLSNSKKK